MATTTPNFGWPVPTSTDLVKDGATAIEALGDSIDASLLDLKGGTTGQVLSKNSNTDMDFIWVTDAAGDITGVTAGIGISGGGTSGTVTVTNSMATAIDAKGDLVSGTGADTFARLPVGTNGQALTADSTAATGLAWATATSGGMSSLASGTLSGASVVLSSISGSYTHLQLAISNFQPATNNATFFIRVNGDSGANRYFAGTVGSASFTFNSTGWQVSPGQQNSTNNGTIIIDLFNYTKTTGYKLGNGIALTFDGANGDSYLNSTLAYNQAAAITSLTMLPSGGNFTGGTYTLWGVK